VSPRWWREAADLDPDAPGLGLLDLFAEAGRLARAAAELADEELLDGAFVDETQLEAAPARLAAADLGGPTVWDNGVYLIRWIPDGGGAFVQQAGPGGLTLVLQGPDGEVFLPLEPGRPAPWEGPRPAALQGLDLRGRAVELPARG
jgi:hypothetical protein